LDYRELFVDVQKRPEMYGLKNTFWSVVPFVLGVDIGTGRLLLTGFEEFLVPKVGFGNNLTWRALVLWLAFPEPEDGNLATLDNPDDDALAVATLFRLLDEFLAIRAPRQGFLKIAADYSEWERQRRGRSKISER
jgi:hypothetical protein